MAKFLDTDHPMFRPLWVRIVVVAATAGWAVLEFTTGSPFWGVLFLAMAAYAAWGFFITFRSRAPARTPEPASTVEARNDP